MYVQSNVIFINLVFMYKVIASISVVDKGILPLEENSIGIRFFIDVTNDLRENFCDLYSQCKKCCLTDSKKDECDVMMCFGENIHMVNPRDRKTLLYVAPIIQQHDLNGYCDVILHYYCNNTMNKTEVIIPFDTRTRRKKSRALMEQYIGNKKVSSCKTLDEDSLNYCEPVKCDAKYLDKRPVFDHNLNKCVEVPTCITNTDKELPDYVYVPNSNTCRNLDLPLTVQDIYAISTGLGTVVVPSPSTIIQVKSCSSTISQNLNLLRDLMYGKLYPMAKGVKLDYTECYKSIIITISTCIISVCVALFLLVCCLNTIVWLYLQWIDGNIKKIWKRIRMYIDRRKNNEDRCKREKVNSTIRNALLREVIVKDIPLELRDSAIEICDKMGKGVEKRRKYRIVDIEGQVNQQEEVDSPFTSISSISLEKEHE